MSDITFSVELVRGYLRCERLSDSDSKAQQQALVAFEVIMECHEAIAEMMQAAMERENEAALALSVLRHPSESVEQLKKTLRQLADLEENGQPVSPAFEQVMDELIAEVRLECAVPKQSVQDRPSLQLVSSAGHGRAM